MDNIQHPYGIDQVDLNYKNPEVLKEMIDLAFFYASNGASRIRLDAITFAWKELYTECVHGKSRLIPPIIKAALRLAGYETAIVTETNVTFHENISYLEYADMIYNFTLQGLLIYALLKDPQPMFGFLDKMKKANDKLLNFISVHDGISMRGLEGLPAEKEISSYLENIGREMGMIKYRIVDGKKVPYEICVLPSEILDKKQLRLAHIFLLFLRGTPGFYYATLFNSRNGKYEEEERDLMRPIISNPDLSLARELSEIEKHAKQFRNSRQEYSWDGNILEIKTERMKVRFNFSPEFSNGLEGYGFEMVKSS